MKKKIQSEHIIFGMFKSSLFVLFLFFGFSASAQSYPNLVEKAEAVTKIQNVLSDKDANIAIHPEGSQAQKDAARSFLLYAHSLEFMLDGMTVEDALTQTFTDFSENENGNSIDLDQFENTILLDNIFKSNDLLFDELVEFLSE